MASSIRKLISEVGKMVELIMAMPATNATSERNFSKSKLLKSYLRNSMSQRRLNHLMVGAICQEHLDDLALEELAVEFVFRNTKRLYVSNTKVKQSILHLNQ